MSHERVVNGQKIPWAFVMKVRNAAGGDWDDVADAFWKARNAKGELGVIKYVSRGLLKDANGNRYSFIPSKERENGKMEEIRRWWESTYQPVVTPAKNALKEVFQALANSL